MANSEPGSGLSAPQLWAAYSTGEVTEIWKQGGGLGVTVWCDGGSDETEGQRWSL